MTRLNKASTAAKFRFEVQHSRETVMTLSRTQYAATHEMQRIVQVITAVVCLLLGTHLIGNIAEPFNYLFSLYGCLVFAFLNVPAKSRAEKVIAQVESSGGAYPCTIFEFLGDRIHVTAKGDAGPGEDHLYKDCRRLVESKGDLYYFISQEAAFLFPAPCVGTEQLPALKLYLEEKTGLRFTSLNLWYNVSLRSLFKSRKNIR